MMTFLLFIFSLVRRAKFKSCASCMYCIDESD